MGELPASALRKAGLDVRVASGPVNALVERIRGPVDRLAYRYRSRRPPRIPALPPGVDGGPPDFVGIGTQKSGTSWWYSLIVSHPDVRANAGGRKELHFFDRFFAESPTDGQVRDYHQHFPKMPSGIVGEWTPRYLYDAWTAPCVARAAPEAKLLVILRDPIDRYRSGLTLARVSAGRRPDRNKAADAFARGCYHAQLTRLGEWFPQSQILILQYERCVAEPLDQLRRTYEFLGLRSNFTPPAVARPVNATEATKEEIDGPVRAALQKAYRADVERLVTSYPEIDLALWDNFST